MISRSAPEAAARVLSDMAVRMLGAHSTRNHSFKSLRRGTTGKPGLGGYVPAPRKVTVLPGHGKSGARHAERGGISTIAFLAVGASTEAASKTVRRCGLPCTICFTPAGLLASAPMKKPGTLSPQLKQGCCAPARSLLPGRTGSGSSTVPCVSDERPWL